MVNEVINKLDVRLNPRFQEPNNRDELLSAINQKSVYNANLWSYDYEGIGSYFAAFFSDGGGINLLGVVSFFKRPKYNWNTQSSRFIKRISKIHWNCKIHKK